MPEGERAGWQLLVVDLAEVTDKPGFLDAVAAGCGFPGWVGRNWDALQDALGDLSWTGPARGRVLVLDGWDAWATVAASDALVARSVLDQAAAEWSDRGTPLHVVGPT